MPVRTGPWNVTTFHPVDEQAPDMPIVVFSQDGPTGKLRLTPNPADNDVLAFLVIIVPGMDEATAEQYRGLPHEAAALPGANWAIVPAGTPVAEFTFPINQFNTPHSAFVAATDSLDYAGWTP